MRANRRADGKKYSTYNQQRRLADHRAGWVHVKGIDAIVLVNSDTDEEGKQSETPDVVLHLPRPGSIPDVYQKLTDLTEAELMAYKELLDKAFEWALPVVQRHDKEAADAAETGDDSFERIYRPLPQLVFRKRKVGEHFESVRLRPNGVSPGGRPDWVADSPGGDGGASGELAQPDAEQGGPVNDSTSPGEPSDLLEMDGLGELS